MKLTVFALIPTLLAIGASAVAQPQKSVLVSYPEDTPDSVVNDAMNVILQYGGMITHQYTLFKGFAATAPAKALEAVQAYGNHDAVIEDDQTVQTN